MAHGDPFLAYREGSNNLLGVVSIEGLACSCVVLVPLFGVLVVGVGLRDTWSMTISGAGLFALPLLTVNDVWGANAEPYRFWIEAVPLGGVLAALGLARLAGQLLTRPSAGPPAPDSVKWSSSRRSWRAGLLATIIATGALWAASLPDWVNYLHDPAMQAVWDPGTGREVAIRSLAEQATRDPAHGLLTTDACIDNRTTKVTSGSPIANYYLGMAWPVNRTAIDAINMARNASLLDFSAMDESGTTWVLTDSTCPSKWGVTYARELELVASRSYRLDEPGHLPAGPQPHGTITLWRVTSQ
jgi:hypothetical protein